MALADNVKELVATKFKIEPSRIGMNTHFFNELGADSLEMLSFVTELESKYSVVVPSEELEKFHCLENILTFLSDRSAASV